MLVLLQRQRTDGGPSSNGGGGAHGQSFAHQQQGYLRGASPLSSSPPYGLPLTLCHSALIDSFFEDPWTKLFAARASKA